jgi:hypothetical protein
MFKQPLIISRLLCWLNVHDFKVTDTTYGFGDGGVEKVQC